MILSGHLLKKNIMTIIQTTTQEINHYSIHGSLVLCVVQDGKQWIHLGQYLQALKSPLSIGQALIAVIVKTGGLHVKSLSISTLSGDHSAAFISWTAASRLQGDK